MANFSDTGSAPARTPPGRPQFTGRYLLLGRQPNDSSFTRSVRDATGLTMASSSDFHGGAVDVGKMAGADGVYLEKLGVAITSSAPDQATAITGMATRGDLVTVERERFVYIFAMPRRDNPPMVMPSRLVRVQGFGNLVCSLGAPIGVRDVHAADLDESARTWGLVSTGVINSSRTGRGVRVAVLDTGFDLNHPDFVGRNVVAHSFVDGESAQDGHSHGTHCVGTALGPAQPGTLPRYGVAHGADVYVGKVLGNSGSGSDGAILSAINWAITNGCRVISMSLGSDCMPGQKHSQVFEAAAQRALAANTLILAAAGNESNRPDVINPVGHPANCPSVMAVGAVDADMNIAVFSTRGTEPDGGGVDIAGPGVNIYSTVPMPKRYGTKSGTSMACPHVAGIAALYAEANPNVSAKELWQLLVNNTKRLDLDASDVGTGLAQAPR